MSSNLETLQKQIASGEDLSSIVRTMKALAATSVRQYEKAAESLDDYYHTVELGLAVALAGHSEKMSPPGKTLERPILLLVFGSDHGLAGRFNEQIVSFSLKDYWAGQKNGPGPAVGDIAALEAEKPGMAHAAVSREGADEAVAQEEAKLPARAIVAAIGEQVVNRVTAAGIEPVAGFTMPTSINAITPFVQVLLENIWRWRTERSPEKIYLFYNRPSTGTYGPRAELLLPVDLSHLREKRLTWQSRSLPTYTMPQEKLIAALLRQYFFVSIYRACALSLAAENTSRLTAMQAAEKNIDERLERLRGLYQQERQAAITEELLDIISGFKAVRGKLTG